MDLDKDKLKSLAISESGLIFDPSTGFIYTSNPVGLLILDALKHTKEPIEIRDMIVKQYDIDEKTAEIDMYDFLSQLKQLKDI